MRGNGAIYISEGENIQWTPTADVEANQVIQFGKLIGVTRKPYASGELTTAATVGEFGLPTAGGITASLGETARFDIAAQKLVATGGVVIGVYSDKVTAADAYASVILIRSAS